MKKVLFIIFISLAAACFSMPRVGSSIGDTAPALELEGDSHLMGGITVVKFWQST